MMPTTPRPIPWAMTLLVSLLLWSALLMVAMIWHEGSSSTVLAAFPVPMFAGVILDAVVRRRRLGPAAPRSARQFLLSLLGVLAACALLLLVVRDGLTLWTAPAAAGALALCWATVRYEHVAQWRGALARSGEKGTAPQGSPPGPSDSSGVLSREH
jgi:peptidoglycan/LPS O-acetylase OafA/YrhL